MSSEDILQQLKESYLLGIPAHLEEMENYILSLEEGRNHQKNFEALYRKAHSLKGSGGTYGYPIITSACHQMEDFISNSMQNSDDVNTQAVDTIFKYINVLKDIHSLLYNKNDNFDEIENQLKNLKGKAITEAINGIYVGSQGNLYNICTQIFSECNVHCTAVKGGVDTLQRVLHEHFDFIITSRENIDLNGLALIAAIKLNRKKDSKIKTILITSNQPPDVSEAVNPDYIILKNKSFDVSLSSVLEEIEQSR